MLFEDLEERGFGFFEMEELEQSGVETADIGFVKQVVAKEIWGVGAGIEDLFEAGGVTKVEDFVDNGRVVCGNNADAVTDFERKWGAADIEDDVEGLLRRGGSGKKGSFFNSSNIGLGS